MKWSIPLILILMILPCVGSTEQLATSYAGGLLDQLDEKPNLPPPGFEKRPTRPNEKPQVPGLSPKPLIPPSQGPKVPPAPKPKTPAGRVETPPQFQKYTRFDVWDPFYQKFKRCEPECEPIVNNLHRPGDPRCHGVGRAIDIEGMNCGGRRFRAIDNGRFEQMVMCMKHQQKMLTLWHNGPRSDETGAHWDHAHFGIGCHSGY